MPINMPNFLSLAQLPHPAVQGAQQGMDLFRGFAQNMYLPDMLKAQLQQALLGNQKSQAELPYAGPQAEANLFGKQFENEKLKKLMPFLVPGAQANLANIRQDILKKQLEYQTATSQGAKDKAKAELDKLLADIAHQQQVNEYYPQKTQAEIGKDVRETPGQRVTDWLFGKQSTGFEQTPTETELNKNLIQRIFGKRSGESIIDKLSGKKARPPEPGMVHIDVDGKKFWVDPQSLNEIRKDHPTMKEI